MIFIKSLVAAFYFFRVSLLLSAEKIPMTVEDYPDLTPFVRQCRVSGLSPSECVFLIKQLVSNIDGHIQPTDERWKPYRNRILAAALNIWDETVTMVRPQRSSKESSS